MKMQAFQTFEVSWPWPRIRLYEIPSCITDWPPTTCQLSTTHLKSTLQSRLTNRTRNWPWDTEVNWLADLTTKFLDSRLCLVPSPLKEIMDKEQRCGKQRCGRFLLQDHTSTCCQNNPVEELLKLTFLVCIKLLATKWWNNVFIPRQCWSEWRRDPWRK